MAGIFSTIGSMLNVVTSVAEGLEEQANGWREVGSYAVYKAQAEGARDFLEELGVNIPDSTENIIRLASLLKELMALSSAKEKDSKQIKRLQAVKSELAEIAESAKPTS